MEISPLMMRMPIARIIAPGSACPTSTSGFLRNRSAITPPNGPTSSIPMPDPICAIPADVLVPVMS